MLHKKPDVLIVITLAYVYSRKMKDIHFYCWGYENSKGWAIIQDFIAHWAINNKEMVNVWTFDSFRMRDVLIFWFGHWIKFSNIRHFLILYHWVCRKILDNSQPFKTFTSFKIKMDVYQFLRGNGSRSYLSWFNIWIIWEHPSI